MKDNKTKDKSSVNTMYEETIKGRTVKLVEIVEGKKYRYAIYCNEKMIEDVEKVHNINHFQLAINKYSTAVKLLKGLS